MYEDSDIQTFDIGSLVEACEELGKSGLFDEYFGGDLSEPEEELEDDQPEDEDKPEDEDSHHPELHSGYDASTSQRSHVGPEVLSDPELDGEPLSNKGAERTVSSCSTKVISIVILPCMALLLNDPAEHKWKETETEKAERWLRAVSQLRKETIRAPRYGSPRKQKYVSIRHAGWPSS